LFQIHLSASKKLLKIYGYFKISNGLTELYVFHSIPIFPSGVTKEVKNNIFNFFGCNRVTLSFVAPQADIWAIFIELCASMVSVNSRQILTFG